MRKRTSAILSAATFFTLVLLVGCPPFGGDDDTSTPEPTVPPATPTMEPMPTPTPKPVAVTGEVRAVDRYTGESISTATYLERAGVIVVYALLDPADLVHPLSKAVLAEPGFYQLDVPENIGDIFVVAVADLDSNDVISPYDLSREAEVSPVTVGTETVEDVDIILDLAARTGGSGPHPGYAPFAGIVTYDSPLPKNIAVVAFRGDFEGWYWGMARRQGTGDYLCSISMWSSTTSLVGYADEDENGVFEPSDPAGLPEHNPYPLGPDGATGVDILIETVGPVGLPVPLPYISVAGTVYPHDAYAGTPIYVSLEGADGQIVYDRTTLSGPDNFTLRVPGNLAEVTLKAITDSDGDGELNPVLDAHGDLGPFSLGGSNVGGKNITLEAPGDPVTGLTGVINYKGTTTSEDILVIGVYTSTDMSGTPAVSQYASPAFPVSYEFLNLDEVLEEMGATSHTFYVSAVLDIGGDLSEEVDPNDVLGWYSADGQAPQGVTVDQNHIAAGVNFTMGNWHPVE